MDRGKSMLKLSVYELKNGFPETRWNDNSRWSLGMWEGGEVISDMRQRQSATVLIRVISMHQKAGFEACRDIDDDRAVFSRS